MKRYFAIMMLSALLCMTGCEKVIEFDMDETDPLVVLSSTATSDSAFAVSLTYSRFFLDNSQFRVISDASVVLTRNGVQEPVPVFDAGKYRFGCIPQPGDTLHLDVLVPGQEPVSAGTRVPLAPQVSNLSIVESGTTDYGYSTYDVRFTLTDDVTEKGNAYRVMMYFVDTIDFDTMVVEREEYTHRGWVTWLDTVLPHQEVEVTKMWMKSDDPLLASTDVTNFLDELKTDDRKSDESVYVYLFTDDGFSGGSHEFKVKAETYRYFYGGKGAKSPDGGLHHEHYYLYVSSLNRDLYLFTTTQDAQRGGDLEGIFTEPVQIFYNVKGGIGIFGGRTNKRFEMLLPNK